MLNRRQSLACDSKTRIVSVALLLIGLHYCRKTLQKDLSLLELAPSFALEFRVMDKFRSCFYSTIRNKNTKTKSETVHIVCEISYSTSLNENK